MNALFDVKFHVTVNDRTIVALATATGFFVAALPTPRPPKLQQARGGDEQVYNESFGSARYPNRSNRICFLCRKYNLKLDFDD